MGREGRQLNKCIFIGSMICVFPSNLDKIGRRNSTMWFIYLFIYFNRLGLSSHNHKNSSYTFSLAPRLRSTRGTHLCGSHGLSEPSSPLSHPRGFGALLLWVAIVASHCAYDLKIRHFFFSCAVLHTVGEEGGVFLLLKPYRATTERLLLCVCSSPFSPLLEV